MLVMSPSLGTMFCNIGYRWVSLNLAAVRKEVFASALLVGDDGMLYCRVDVIWALLLRSMDEGTVRELTELIGDI
jgi:hypothetical protein